MAIIARNIKWIMLVTGIITCSMFLAMVSPHLGLVNTFGESLPDAPIMQIVVRNWGALIGLFGCLLIYGAFTPMYRPLILVSASIGKIIFIALVLSFGTQYLAKAGIAVAFDTIAVVLYVACFLSLRQNSDVGDA